jgi:outer membrane protein TolC
MLFYGKGMIMKQRGETLRRASRFLLVLPFVLMGLSLARSADSPTPLQQPPAQPTGAVDPNVLTLDEAVLTALANHPNLKAARERIGAQEAVVGQQMAAYFPTVTLNNQYRTSQSQDAASKTSASETFISQGIFNYMIYDFGKREGAVEAARETLNATGHNYKTTVDGVILGAKQAYYVVLGSQAIVKVREETVKNRELLVKQARGFYEVGTRAKIDVARAEANLYTAQADLIQAQNNVKVSWVTLKNALGLRELPERPLVEEAIMTTIPFTLEQARELAYVNRPELKSFEAQRKAQDQNIAVARRGHLPDLNFDAAYGRRHESDEVQRFAAGNRHLNTFPLQPAWAVGVVLNIPIFDGLRTTYRVQETLSNYHVIRAQEEAQRQQVALDVESAYLRLVELQERIKANEAAANAAKENLDLANGRYQVGVGSIIEVTDAQTLHTEAQTTYVRALYEYKIADAQLARAIGQ